VDSSRRLRLDRAARARLEAWGLPLLPALLAGAHLEGLLLFLNPEVALTLPGLLRGSLVYGLLLAPLSLAVHLGLARRRRVAVRRLVPWSLTLVAAFGALGDWVHASRYTFFLPPGINVQMIKTALWLTLGALIFFYTALLHSLHERRYGPRSRLLLLLVALGTVYALFDRRTSFRPAIPTLPRFVGLAAEGAPRLALVVLPSATLDAVLPLAEQGRLPFFSFLLAEGARARLAPFGPMRPLALETTLATGKLPYRHGLVGDDVVTAPWHLGEAPLRLLPFAVGFRHWGIPGGRWRAESEVDLRALPLWTLLLRLGRGALAVGFPPPLGTGALATTGALPPAGAERELELLGEPQLAAALAADRLRLTEARTRWSADDRALFVRLEGLEDASLALFGGFQAALFEGRRERSARRAADLLVAYYGGLDSALAELWAGLPEPRLLAVASPYGVGAPQGLERIVLDLLGRPRLEGRLRGAPDGLLLLAGDGVRRGVPLPAGSIADLAPTLLYALALPVPRDADGRVLVGAFEPALLQRRPLTFVPSYEGLPGPAAASAP